MMKLQETIQLLNHITENTDTILVQNERMNDQYFRVKEPGKETVFEQLQEMGQDTSE